MPVPVAVAMKEFLLHGLKFIWPAKRGPMTRGVATGSSCESVSRLLDVSAPGGPLVRPHPEGTLRGEAVDPLYRSMRKPMPVLELWRWCPYCRHSINTPGKYGHDMGTRGKLYQNEKALIH